MRRILLVAGFVGDDREVEYHSDSRENRVVVVIELRTLEQMLERLRSIKYLAFNEIIVGRDAGCSVDDVRAALTLEERRSVKVRLDDRVPNNANNVAKATGRN
ncbi:hypothetical protein EPN28_04755 [Patescibacteria group bacterium]|nr:MAG: hypothetical protein EPN28_04755 [Patescibacteria group bacterium]